jgi:hypothetical protein
MEKEKTIAVWFSCGAASAIAAKKTIELYGKTHNVIIVNNPIKEEHEDNRRFLRDIEEYLQYPIVEAINSDFPNASIVEVFDKRKYMCGIQGAPCTMLLKKEARYQFELNHEIDFHVLGFTVDEWDRQKSFSERERGNSIPVLITSLTTKEDCFKILRKDKIKLPEVYSMGLPNANCIGCVKASSPTYWNLIRSVDIETFNQRCEQSRRIGAKLVIRKGKRIFLDELLPTDKGGKIKSWECGIFCNLD